MNDLMIILLSLFIFAAIAPAFTALWGKPKSIASKAPVAPAPASELEVGGIVLTESESAPDSAQEAVQVAELPDVKVADSAHEQVRVLPMDYAPGRSVNLAALLRDVDYCYPQLAIKPTHTLEEIHHNAGARDLANWMRQQYLARGKQAGSMSKAPTI